MHCIRKLSDDLIWIGASEHRAARFENHYPVPEGMSYNSYVLLDEKAVLFDTADSAVAEIFFENLAKRLMSGDNDVVTQKPEPEAVRQPSPVGFGSSPSEPQTVPYVRQDSEQ